MLQFRDIYYNLSQDLQDQAQILEYVMEGYTLKRIVERCEAWHAKPTTLEAVQEKIKTITAAIWELIPEAERQVILQTKLAYDHPQSIRKHRAIWLQYLEAYVDLEKIRLGITDVEQWRKNVQLCEKEFQSVMGSLVVQVNARTHGAERNKFDMLIDTIKRGYSVAYGDGNLVALEVVVALAKSAITAVSANETFAVYFDRVPFEDHGRTISYPLVPVIGMKGEPWSVESLVGELKKLARNHFLDPKEVREPQMYFVVKYIREKPMPDWTGSRTMEVVTDPDHLQAAYATVVQAMEKGYIDIRIEQVVL